MGKRASRVANYLRSLTSSSRGQAREWRQTRRTMLDNLEPRLLLSTVPNESSSPYWQYLYQHSGQYGINTPNAWDITQGSSDVVVAVVDSGIDFTDPSLAARIWHNPTDTSYDQRDNDNDGVIDDVIGPDFSGDIAYKQQGDFGIGEAEPLPDGIGHGTHVSGIIAASANNYLGANTSATNVVDTGDTVGVAPNVKIMPVQVFDDTGSMGTTSYPLINALNYIDLMKRRGVNLVAVNLSLGAGLQLPGAADIDKTQTWLLQQAIDKVTGDGVILVFSAGNFGADNSFFGNGDINVANNPMVVQVAASDPNGNLATFPSVINPGSSFGGTTQVAAPGLDILSTWPRYLDPSSSIFFTDPAGNAIDPPVGASFDSGTSMAAPMVTGTIALMKSANPNATPQQILNALYSTARMTPGLQGTVQYGLIDAYGAVEAILGAQKPTGSVDIINGQQIAGWAFDANAGDQPAWVRITIDGVNYDMAANQPRLDLASVLGSTAHGFSFALPSDLSAGEHSVQVWVADSLNSATSGTDPTLIANTSFNSSVPPIGYVDQLTSSTISGWAWDYNAGTQGSDAVTVRIVIDGSAQDISADVDRADLQSYLGSSKHAFSYDVPALSVGPHDVQVYAIDQPSGAETLLNSQTLVVNAAPVGSIDVLNGAGVMGWYYDPDMPSAALNMRVDIDGQAGGLIAANLIRQDIGTATSDNSTNHGFNYALPNLAPGTHTLQLYVLDPTTGAPVLVATRTIMGNRAPIGYMDGANSQQVFGWTADPDNLTQSNYVRVDVDNTQGVPVLANSLRGDLASVIGSSSHGFAVNLPSLAPGMHTVQVWALDATTYVPTLLATQAISVANPVSGNVPATGAVDVVSLAQSMVTGWAYDADSGAAPIDVQVKVDGTVVAIATANEARPDLAGLTNGTNHGYTATLPLLQPGEHQVEVYAVDPQTGQSYLIRGVEVSAQPPVGHIESVTPGVITGYALDPSSSSTTLVRLDIDGVMGSVVPTSIARPDLGLAQATVGFQIAVPALSAGTHTARLYVVDAVTKQATLVDQSTLATNHLPMGAVDVLNNQTISGWAFDADNPTTPVNIEIDIDGVAAIGVSAGNTRSDLQSVLGSTNHGFSYTFSGNVSSGAHTITVRAIDLNTGENSVVLKSAVMHFA